MSTTDSQGREAADEVVPQRVPVNMYETEGALVIVSPLPGVMADDIEITIGRGQAVIKAAMRTAAGKDYILHEWHYGPYERTIDIPEGFGGAGAATFGNGQLALRVERGEPAADPVVVHPTTAG